jgi:hypothetical protein
LLQTVTLTIKMSQETNKNQEEKKKRIRKIPSKFQDFDTSKKPTTKEEEEEGELFQVKDINEEKKNENENGIKKQTKMVNKKSLLERLKKTVSNVKETNIIETKEEKNNETIEEKPIIKEEVKTKSKPVKVTEKRKKETENETETETDPEFKIIETPKKEDKKEKRPQRKKVKFDEDKSDLKPQLQQCFKILQDIKKDQWSWPFAEPVDIVALNIPDYYNVIKFPMDLKTIEKKLFSNKYEKVEDFATDMRRIWSNCYTYNAPTTDISLMAKKLDNVFEEKIKKLLETTESTILKKIVEVEEEKEEKKEEVVNKKKKPIKVQSNPSSNINNITSLSSSMDSRQMPFEEKKKLSNNISRLDSNKLAKVVEIIQSRAPRASSQATETEIEIDLDKLDNVTLRQIEKYVKQSLTKSRGSSNKKSTTTNVQIKKKENKQNEETESSESSSAEETNSDTDEENNNSAPVPITQGKTTN